MSKFLQDADNDHTEEDAKAIATPVDLKHSRKGALAIVI